MKSLQLAKPHLLMTVGIPGSGKSFFAEKFSETFNAPLISFTTIHSLATDETAAQKLVQNQLQELLKTKQTIIIDGATDTRTQRSELARLVRANGYEPLLIWVQTDPVTSKSRAVKKSAGTMTSEEFARALRRFTAPNAAEKSVVISGKHTSATQMKVVLKKLSEPRAPISVHSASPVLDSTPTRRNITIR